MLSFYYIFCGVNFITFNQRKVTVGENIFLLFLHYDEFATRRKTPKIYPVI